MRVRALREGGSPESESVVPRVIFVDFLTDGHLCKMSNSQNTLELQPRTASFYEVVMNVSYTSSVLEKYQLFVIHEIHSILPSSLPLSTSAAIAVCLWENIYL